MQQLYYTDYLQSVSQNLQILWQPFVVGPSVEAMSPQRTALGRLADIDFRSQRHIRNGRFTRIEATEQNRSPWCAFTHYEYVVQTTRIAPDLMRRIKVLLGDVGQVQATVECEFDGKVLCENRLDGWRPVRWAIRVVLVFEEAKQKTLLPDMMNHIYYRKFFSTNSTLSYPQTCLPFPGTWRKPKSSQPYF